MTQACEAILNDFAASHWLKLALVSALERDPVDAAADAAVLASVLREHRDNVQQAMAEAMGLNLAQLQMELWRNGDGPG